MEQFSNIYKFGYPFKEFKFEYPFFTNTNFKGDEKRSQKEQLTMRKFELQCIRSLLLYDHVFVILTPVCEEYTHVHDTIMQTIKSMEILAK